jgi:hypothetical protein
MLKKGKTGISVFLFVFEGEKHLFLRKGLQRPQEDF